MPDAAALAPLFDWRSAICDSDLTPTQRHVALTLSLHMNARGGSAMPAVDTLCRETGLARSTVRDSLKRLHERGWLDKRNGAGMNGTNMYLACIPAGALLERKRQEGLTTSGPTADPPGRQSGADTRPPDAHARPWSPVYDALLRHLYPAGAQLTREEGRRLALAARELHEAGATPADVESRIAAYKAHPTYRDVALTAMSLRSHWSELAPRAKAAPPCAECGVGGGQHTADCTRAAG